eukprot:c12105_g1_i1 orf=650-2863(-)
MVTLAMEAQGVAMRGDEGATLLARTRGGFAAMGWRASMAEIICVCEGHGLREFNSRAKERGTRTSVALAAMDLRSRVEGNRKETGSVSLSSVGSRGTLCSTAMSSMGHRSIAVFPNLKVSETKEATTKGQRKERWRSRCVLIKALAATVPSSRLEGKVNARDCGDHTASMASNRGEGRDELMEWENLPVDTKKEHGKSASVEARAAIVPSSRGTLIGGVGGSRRQDGKIILPNFTITEAKDVTKVCRILQQEGQWTPRVEQALLALSSKLNTRILARILKCQTNPSLAWKIFQWAESLPCFMHDSHTFYALIEILGKAEDLQAIWTIIDDMRIAGIRVKPIPFTFLISSYGRAGKVQEAEIALHSMREFNCKPNVYTYNAMLFALLKAQKTERALFTYSKMLDYGCRPDTVTFNTLINGFCLIDHTEQAVYFLGEMLKQGFSPDMRTFNTLIGKFLKLGQLQKALNVYELALKRGCKPNTITHTMLLDWLFKMGKFDDALKLFKEMANSGCDLDTVAFTAFLHGLFKCGKVEMAFSFFESLVKRGYANVATYNIVVDWFCKNKKLDQAVEVLRDMQRRGLSPDTFTYNSLIYGSFKKGRPGMGFAFATQMIDGGCSPDLITYTLMVEFFLKEGELDDALALLNEMTCNGYRPDTIIYNPLILGLFRAGKSEMALSTAREMMQNGCCPNKMTYRVLNSWLCKQGQSEEALEFIKEMTSLGCDASSLSQTPDASELLPI